MMRRSGEGVRRYVVRSTNWMWALGTLAVWAGIFFAFLLIAIARP
jgi:hypothetical protein